ncbi:FtsX-like permease family protein [Glycomyces paridis]|uniref:ABC transporter permease n=1 Tax=Glycomyces paridis TaxID=2126555 RepID=A0A4S8PT01_9ACTN|nr:FtsX-like permease family protein [Glycomyces paridis]THV31264.1 ABC transporter permease [Glycomyces paridis]
MFAGLRLSLRIARREALRYKGRSALSIALLGLPLLGVSIGATAYDTITLSEEETARQHLGENDAFVESVLPGESLEQLTWYDQWPMYDAPDDFAVEEGEAIPEPPGKEAVLAALPEGSRIAPFTLYPDGVEGIKIETPSGVGEIGALGYDLDDELYERAGLEYVEGSAPQDGEVALSSAAAEYLELGVGDELAVQGEEGERSLTVGAVVELPWFLNGRYAIGEDFAAPYGGWLVDVPGEFTYEQALPLNEMGMTAWATSLVLDPPPSAVDPAAYTMQMDEAMFTVYGLIVVVVVMEVVLLAGPAFAISARRRTREFALMSANGASPAQIRNTVLAGGVLFGLIAAAAAVVLGILAVLVGTPLLEGMYGHRSAGLRFLPLLQTGLVALAIVTGLLSALAAALSASRVNVIAALMGRTPGRKGSKKLLFLGLGLVAVAVAAGIGGVVLWSLPLMALAIVAGQLGLVACTPAILSGMAALGRWLPLAPRMALREAGRNRGSAAPAIAAVLGVVAAGTAFAMVVTADSVRSEQSTSHELAQGSLSLSLYAASDEMTAAQWEAARAEADPVLHRHLEDLEVVELPLYTGWQACGVKEEDPGQDAECTWTVTRPEEHRCPYWEAIGDGSDEATVRAAVEDARKDPVCNEGQEDTGQYTDGVPATTDRQIVANYTELEGEELDDAVALLKAGGVLVSDPLAITDEGTVVLERSLTVWDESGSEVTSEPVTLELPAMAVAGHLLGTSELFLSPAAAEQMELVSSLWQREYLLKTSTEVDASVVEAIKAELGDDVLDGTVWTDVWVTDYTDPFTRYLVLAVTGLCALIALGATAVSTGLIIAEQRQDMTTLGAVGAAPTLRKRFAMWQTVMIALFGAGLGTLAGVVGYALLREALNNPLKFRYPFETLYGWELPWASIGITVLAVPVVAAIGALVFTRARLPSERRMT